MLVARGQAGSHEYGRLPAAGSGGILARTLELREPSDRRDVDAKIALACHYYFLEGPERGRSLLVEAQALDPDNTVVRDFLDQLK